MQILRQGDVLLRRTDKAPEQAGKPVKDGVIAKGETTGHAHRVKGGRVVESGGQMLVFAGAKTELVHEEHGHLQIPEGVYEVVRQREYDPIAERQVTD